MRRATALAIGVLALLAPSPAVSSSESYSTSTTAKRGEFWIGFDAIYVNGKPDAVRKFRFRRVVMTCTVGGSFTTKSEPPHFGPFNVNDQGKFGRAFRNAGPSGDVTVVIRGDFVTKHKVEGTLKINGDYPPEYSDCASGKLAWEAKLA